MINIMCRETILDFLRKYSLKIIGVILSVLILVVSLYALLCTVYSDVIVQNDNDFITLAEKSLTEKEIETTFEELIGIEKKHKNLYVFVLDISGSLKKTNLAKTTYDKYKRGVDAVNNKFGGKVLSLKDRNNMDVFDFSKSRLYELLLVLLKKNEYECKSEFAIWTLGDEAVKIYPDDRKADVTNNLIKAAIREISKPINNADSNTNFVSLFYRLKEVYELELGASQRDPYESPSFIITILSDLIHDVKNSYNSRSRELNENWNELKEEIQVICNSKIMANMIVFSEKDPDIQRSVFSLFKDNIEWYRLNKFLIEEKERNTFLFTVRTTKKNIVFYYENPNFIAESTFTIRYSHNKADKIRIDIPAKANSLSSQKIILSCQQINAVNEPLGNEQKIITGGNEYEVELGKNQKLRLSFTGRLPSNLLSPILRITMTDNGKTYMIPIDFIKRLPDWASRLFIFLKRIFYRVSWFGGFLIVAMLSIFLYLKFFVKEPVLVRSEGSISEEESSPEQKPMDKDEDHILEINNSQPNLEKNELININTAALNELKKLMGINAKRARKIRDNRSYEKISDLKPIIGNEIYKKIKDQICV